MRFAQHVDAAEIFDQAVVALDEAGDRGEFPQNAAARLDASSAVAFEGRFGHGEERGPADGPVGAEDRRLDLMVLDGGPGAVQDGRMAAQGAGGGIIRRRAAEFLPRVRVDVNADEQVRVLPVGEVGAFFERGANVGRAGEEDGHALAPKTRADGEGDFQRDFLFVEVPVARLRAGVVAAVAGIYHDLPGGGAAS